MPGLPHTAVTNFHVCCCVYIFIVSWQRRSSVGVGTDDSYLGPPQQRLSLTSLENETETAGETQTETREVGMETKNETETSEMETETETESSEIETDTETDVELPMHHRNESFRADMELFLPQNETIDERKDVTSAAFDSGSDSEFDRPRTDTIPFETGSESSVAVSVDSVVSSEREARERLMSDVMAEEWTGWFHFYFVSSFTLVSLFCFTFRHQVMHALLVVIFQPVSLM